LKAALAELVAKDDVVYRGWATHLIPRDITHVLRVALVADRDYRVGRATERHGVGAKEAAVQIKKTDQAAADWTHTICKTGPWEAALYDVKIPMQTTTVDEAVELICEAIKQDALRPTDRSVQAALDFLLATRANLALLDEGHHYCDVKAESGHLTVIIRRKPSSWGQLGRTIYALRLEQLEREVTETAKAIEGVKSVEVRPGSWHRRRASTLLVDDEREYVMTLSERLQMRDIPAEVVYDGFQALDAVESEAPDVMVLDLRMPGMDGLEVLRRVRQDYPDIQVIVVTGHGSDEDERIARQLGAFEYLEKPVDINVLAETIRKASAQDGAEPEGDESEGEAADTKGE
jgi:CheY-like chemotaxis protein